MIAIWLGVLLVVAGVAVTATQVIRGGRLSRGSPRPAAPNTLEPPQRGGGFGFAKVWPGLAMIALGVLFALLGSG